MKSRKTQRANIEKTVPFFFRVGLIVSISVAIVAFEWKTPYSVDDPEVCHTWVTPVEETLQPVTYRLEKPIQLPDEDTKIIVKKPEPVNDPEPVKNKHEPIKPVELNDDFVEGNEIPEKLVPEPFLMVSEVAPRFPGGDKALKNYLIDNVDYPVAAQEIDLNGKVYISFIVSKSGEIRNVKILKDIGGGCGEEAVRVIEEMPNWVPGKQGGEKVNVQMKLCLNFGLL